MSTTYTVNNPYIRWSRGWNLIGSTQAVSIYCGDSVSLYVGNATYIELLGPQQSGLASYYPRIRYSLCLSNASNPLQPPFDATQAAGYDGPNIGALLGNGYSTLLEVLVEDLNIVDDRWGNGSAIPLNCLRISGFTTDGTLLPYPYPALDDWYLYGDSTGEGTGAGTGPLNGAAALKSAEEAFPTALGMAMGVNLTRFCTGGIGYAWGGVCNVPAVNSSSAYYYNGASKLTSGQYTIQPKGIICVLGINDVLNGVSNSAIQAAVVTWMSQERAKAPNALLVMCVPPASGLGQSAISAGFAQYVAATGDTNAIFVDVSGNLPRFAPSFSTGATQWSGDGIHTNAIGSGVVGAALAAGIQYQRALKTGVQRNIYVTP